MSRPDSVITQVSAIAFDIEYIPLQPSANTLIKAIDKIETRGNKIYINLIDNILCGIQYYNLKEILKFLNLNYYTF